MEARLLACWLCVAPLVAGCVLYRRGPAPSTRWAVIGGERVT